MADLFDSIQKFCLLEEQFMEILSNVLSGDRIVDLLLHKPREFINRCNFKTLAESQEGELVTIEAKYESYYEKFPKFRKTKRLHKFFFRDKNDDVLEVIFFAKTYLQKKLKMGEWYLINGKLGSSYQMSHPEKILRLDEVSKLLTFDPRYRLSEGISNYRFSSLVDNALASIETIQDWLDRDFLRAHNLPGWNTAIRHLHHPSSEGEFEQACRRLAYDEILAMHLVSSSLHKQISSQKKEAIKGNGSITSVLRTRLDFSLTRGQEEIIVKIYSLQNQTSRMIALLQGDVGSGKTLAVFFAMLNAVEAGKQTVLLSPTTVLAKQHFELLRSLMPELEVALLIGGQVGSSKKSLLRDVQSGSIKIVIATHAVLSDKVIFANLGLLVIDEQHRFGADQRTKLIRENTNSDLLLISATPIPRTIGQVLFGSITFLNLREKPKCRPNINTSTIAKEKIEQLIERLKIVLKDGSKVFWVCPIIEESENIQVISIKERLKMLKQHFLNEVDCIHGGLSAHKIAEKIADFRESRIKIILSTTVIEVGVDIPDADIMVIEDADRFGLAQLHQLRGRVGRGSKKSFCVLLYDAAKITDSGKKRLKILRSSNDGFFIAEEDFKLRGSGDILGVRQSGFCRFRFLDRAFEHSLFESAAAKSTCAVNKGDIDRYQVLIKIFFSDNNYYL
ncbi:helicase conserved domain protein [Neorickettsia helminthoeca str. Oregon]|uniref:Helicase conserved domain protein n=1 Tax=Neorickettsia helminthoeca str. Oregon TaxID=1286528 RepID=X5GX26_9RICK|nr:ATP-dependent DNA helicase RecG [Neorickettsia helminthoeca]AHX11587.1 helicase conserved domain protein [Neorickettsia helminthoeca str. Oregon]